MMGDSDLDRMLAKLREIEGLPEKAAPEVAIAVRKALEATIAAGTTSTGEAWKETKEGKKPLQTAASYLRVTSIGPRVFAALSGHIARHNNGTANGRVQRRILPKKADGIPSKMAKGVLEAVRESFNDVMGGK